MLETRKVKNNKMRITQTYVHYICNRYAFLRRICRKWVCRS